MSRKDRTTIEIKQAHEAYKAFVLTDENDAAIRKMVQKFNPPETKKKKGGGADSLLSYEDLVEIIENLKLTKIAMERRVTKTEGKHFRNLLSNKDPITEITIRKGSLVYHFKNDTDIMRLINDSVIFHPSANEQIEELSVSSFNSSIVDIINKLVQVHSPYIDRQSENDSLVICYDLLAIAGYPKYSMGYSNQQKAANIRKLLDRLGPEYKKQVKHLYAKHSANKK